ncbi:MAG: MFS transporter [Acidimicrobiia bacterium]
MDHSPDAVYERRWIILAVLCLSLVLVVVGNSSLNVALPSISRELDASQTQLQWIVDAYAIVFAGLLLPAGALGDRFGRKGALQLGLVIFGIGTTLATFAGSAGQVIACRALMGLGAALVMPGTLSILAAVFPPQERPKAIAIWAGLAGAGGALGMVSSGVLLAHFWWGSVFFVNLPVIGLSLAAGAILLPTSKDDRAVRLDGIGSLLSIAGLGMLVYSIIEAPVHGWLKPETFIEFGIAVALLASFILWEKRTPNPMLELSFFSNRKFSIGCTSIFLAFFAMFGSLFLLSQYLQSVRGYSPLAAGVRTLPMTVVMMIAAPASSVTLRKFGQRTVVGAGLAIMSAGLLLTVLLDVDSSYFVFVVCLSLFALGMGQAMPPSTSAIMTSLPLNKAGVGSAVNDTTREVAGALGIAVLGSLMTSGYRSHLLSGAPADAKLGVAQAVAIGSRSPDGAALVDSARQAFMTGMHTAFIGAAIASVLGAILAFTVLPKNRANEATAHAPGGMATADA